MCRRSADRMKCHLRPPPMQKPWIRAITGLRESSRHAARHRQSRHIPSPCPRSIVVRIRRYPHRRQKRRCFATQYDAAYSGVGIEGSHRGGDCRHICPPMALRRAGLSNIIRPIAPSRSTRSLGSLIESLLPGSTRQIRQPCAMLRSQPRDSRGRAESHHCVRLRAPARFIRPLRAGKLDPGHQIEHPTLPLGTGIAYPDVALEDRRRLRSSVDRPEHTCFVQQGDERFRSMASGVRCQRCIQCNSILRAQFRCGIVGICRKLSRT